MRTPTDQASVDANVRMDTQGEEAELLAYLNERMQQALLAAGVRVQSVCVESDEDQRGIRVAVALVDAQRTQDAAAVLDSFRLHYQLT